MNPYPRPYGKYVLLESIGAGGMSEVELARRAVDDASYVRFVVIKRVSSGNSTDEAFIRMFSDEARINAELHHANIVQVYDFGKLQDPQTGFTEYFMVMEYVPGLDLRAVQRAAHAAARPVPVRFTLSVLAEVLEALQYAHARVDTLGNPMHIVHRDVNPRNVMLSVRGEVKVIDFGVALAADRLEKTQGRSLKGKFAYMAPEQIEGNVALDGRADLFAAGLMLHELISGRHPFEGLTEIQIMHRVLMGQLPPPEVPPDFPYPDVLKALVGRALAIRREDRYPDAAAFRREVEDAASLAGGLVTPEERAAFLREVDPIRVDGIWTRLRMYREGTWPGARAPFELPEEVAEGVADPNRTVALPLLDSQEVTRPDHPVPRRRGPLLAGLVAVALTLGVVGVVATRGPGGGEEPPVAVDAPGSSSVDPVLAPGSGDVEVAVDLEPDAAEAAPARERPRQASPDEPAATGRAAPEAVTPAAVGEAPREAAPPPSDAPSRKDPARTGAATGGASPTPAPEQPVAAPPAEAPPEATPPDDTPVATGTLLVTSRPVGLQVQVDGRYIGRTPIRGARIPAGAHVVTILGSGGEEYRQDVEIEAGKSVAITHSFERGESDDDRYHR